ncbi:ribonuclease H-like domain-containing protein [Daedaleopsis nitida]|nr:ribonuclease H-like domain-containing protein [Daedaleopsis nitida]
MLQSKSMPQQVLTPSPGVPSRSSTSSTPALVQNQSASTPAASSESPSGTHLFFDKAKAKGRQLQAAKIDVAIVNLVCVGSIPPRVLDLSEWKDAWSAANCAYEPASCSHPEDVQIPAESAFVRDKQVMLLKEQDNLTITFNGGSLKSAQSNTTIHVITKDYYVFFFKGVNSTGFSHTSQYYYESLSAFNHTQVMESIGPQQFRGICSDNTGNMSKAHACHRLSRLCGDIIKMPHFKEPIKALRRTLKFMKKSGDAHEHLRRKRLEMGISRGLVAIGKTRFASIYHSAALLRPRTNGKSITCLESTHATASDVYVFWLACMAGIYDLIKNDTTSGMTDSVKEKIREAMNTQWMQIIQNAPHDVFFPTFVLNPHEFHSTMQDLLNDLNPLAVKTIKIGGSKPGEKPKYPKSITCTCNFLLKLLRIEYEQRNTPITSLTVHEANAALKDQVALFVTRSWPFGRPLSASSDPFEWWKRLNEYIPQAQPLAHLARIVFAITPNSMADERTQSSYTWLNSYLGSRQSVPMVTRMIHIPNWVESKRGTTHPVQRPTVKFRDMSATIYGSHNGSTGVTGTQKAVTQSSSRSLAVDAAADDFDDDNLWSSDDEDESTDSESDNSSNSEAEDGGWQDLQSELNNARSDITLESLTLRDYLSEEPVVHPTDKKVKARTKTTPADAIKTQTVEYSVINTLKSGRLL